MIKIGLFTPNQNPYSETFVQAHKLGLKDEVFYYYGSGFRTKLEGHPPLASRLKQNWLKLSSKLLSKSQQFVQDTIIKDSLIKNNINVALVEYGIHAHRVLPILKRANIPMLVHFHGYDASVPSAIEKCNNYKEVFAYASKVIVVSGMMQKMLEELGCPKEKLVYNPCGPRPEFEEVIPSFNKKQFLAMGRFVDKKAPYYTILAFKKVVEKYDDALLLMAGEGELLNSCKNLVKHFKLENNVNFLGVISSEELKNHLTNSLAFVQHSVRASNGDMEGTPVSIMEAGLAGLPVIASKHAGIPDVIIHNETGLLVKEHDVDEMANHMMYVIENTDSAKTMGQQNRIRVKENFSLEKHLRILQEAINESIAR